MKELITKGKSRETNYKTFCTQFNMSYNRDHDTQHSEFVLRTQNNNKRAILSIMLSVVKLNVALLYVIMLLGYGLEQRTLQVAPNRGRGGVFGLKNSYTQQLFNLEA